jgi:hypothetical protein
LSPTCSDLPITATADGVRIAVRLTPRARAERIEGIAAGALKVSVTAPPVDNQANQALLRFLARAWRLPGRDLSIAVGARSRNKIVHIAGEPVALMARLAIRIAERQP